MTARPMWKGQLRLSLVSIPVEFFSATKTGANISFRQIHGPSGKPVKYEKVVPGIGAVKAEEILKGFELGKDEYLLLDPKDVDAVKLETKKTIELVQFVRSSEIAPLYYDKPYYVVPADELAEEAYRVVRDALCQSSKVGLGQVTMRGREYLMAIRPCGDGLLAETLRYQDEIREAAPLFADIDDAASDSDLLDVAMSLIKRKTRPFDAGSFKDNYAIALREMLDAKRSSRKTPRASTGSAAAPKDNVVDLMAALKESLAKTGGKTSAAKPAAAKAAPKSPAKPRAPRKKSA